MTTEINPIDMVTEWASGPGIQQLRDDLKQHQGHGYMVTRVEYWFAGQWIDYELSLNDDYLSSILYLCHLFAIDLSEITVISENEIRFRPLSHPCRAHVRRRPAETIQPQF